MPGPEIVVTIDDLEPLTSLNYSSIASVKENTSACPSARTNDGPGANCSVNQVVVKGMDY